MRIAYLCHWNLDSGDGVAKKVETQARYWRDAGHDVTIFALAAGEASDREGIRAFPYGKRSRRTQTALLADEVRSFRPDLLYARYDLFLPPVWRLLRSMRTVVEVNSDDRAEYIRFVKWRGPRALAYNEVNRRAILGAARGLVFVTGELQRSSSFARYRGTPSVVVANGIDLRSAIDQTPSERARAIFLGSPRQAWHGVDKLAGLARALSSELDVDLVGYSLAELQMNVPDVPANVHVHGHLRREAYEPLLATADVGFGTLALHRKGMDEAAPLKVREYLEAGLPVVIAYDDPDLAEVEPWWLLRLPNDEGNTEREVGRIRDFIESVRGRRVPSGEVAPLISWQAKERRRLEFLSQVARG